MHKKYIVAAFDWTTHWLRAVVCSDLGYELERSVWPRGEAEDHAVPFLHHTREKYAAPLLVTGRCRAPWPDGFFRQLTVAGFGYDLIDGPPLGSMLRLERRYREDMAFRPAALLAAIRVSRYRLQDWPTFVLRWSLGQAQRRIHTLGEQLLLESPEIGDDDEGPDSGRQTLVTFPSRLGFTPGSFYASHGDSTTTQITLF